MNNFNSSMKSLGSREQRQAFDNAKLGATASPFRQTYSGPNQNQTQASFIG